MTEGLPTVVVVPRERFSETGSALERMYAVTAALFPLVYVDGGSPRHIREYLEAQGREKGFQLIRTDYYLAPNEARNLAARSVGTKYVVFIDNERGEEALRHRIVPAVTPPTHAGLRNASGEIIVLMDSDLENLPSDIPHLISKLNEGYDVVSGWRQARWQGAYFSRKLPSMLANSLISKISRVALHDYGCTFKAYRREVVTDIRLYGQMHRFIPVYCKWEGGRVTELPVQYQPRKYGKTNYGISRTFKVVLDLVLIKFLDKYMHRPIHFFGGARIISFVCSFLAFGLALYFKLTGQKDFLETPLPTLTVMFLIIGILMVLMGVIAEILMRTYYESQNKFPFTIKETINL